MNNKSLTKRQIVALAKKHNLMPTLYSLNRVMSDPRVKYCRNAIDLLQMTPHGKNPVKHVLDTLRFHQSMTEYVLRIRGQRDGNG